jgi:hypothetical protein
MEKLVPIGATDADHFDPDEQLVVGRRGCHDVLESHIVCAVVDSCAHDLARHFIDPLCCGISSASPGNSYVLALRELPHSVVTAFSAQTGLLGGAEGCSGV